jgi:hypothetical protein
VAVKPAENDASGSLGFCFTIVDDAIDVTVGAAVFNTNRTRELADVGIVACASSINTRTTTRGFVADACTFKLVTAPGLVMTCDIVYGDEGTKTPTGHLL